MKIACISQVRDECDIIELFIRNNARVIDHFFIINNDSCDSTQEILDRLIAEGFKITIHHDNNQNYDQGNLLTLAVQNIAKAHDFDWYVFLDADEFYMQDRQTFENALIKAKEEVCKQANKYAVPIVRVQWQTVVPTLSSYRLLKNEKPPAQNNCKIIIPHELVKYTTHIGIGSHGLAASRYPWPIIECMTNDVLKLTHFPVRSNEQIVSKAILSASRMKRNKSATATHFPLMVDYIRNKNYDLGIKDLQYLAAIYNADPNNIEIGEEINLNWSSIKHKDLMEINIMKRLDHQLNK